jgi:hypothetical protein
MLKKTIFNNGVFHFGRDPGPLGPLPHKYAPISKWVSFLVYEYIENLSTNWPNKSSVTDATYYN